MYSLYYIIVSRVKFVKWTPPDLNREPVGYESVALTIELGVRKGQYKHTLDILVSIVIPLTCNFEILCEIGIYFCEFLGYIVWYTDEYIL